MKRKTSSTRKRTQPRKSDGWLVKFTPEAAGVAARIAEAQTRDFGWPKEEHPSVVAAADVVNEAIGCGLHMLACRYLADADAFDKDALAVIEEPPTPLPVTYETGARPRPVEVEEPSRTGNPPERPGRRVAGDWLPNVNVEEALRSGLDLLVRAQQASFGRDGRYDARDLHWRAYVIAQLATVLQAEERSRRGEDPDPC